MPQHPDSCPSSCSYCLAAAGQVLGADLQPRPARPGESALLVPKLPTAPPGFTRAPLAPPVVRGAKLTAFGTALLETGGRL